MVGSKTFDFYALSWGILRRIACNVVETAQRKSQSGDIIRNVWVRDPWSPNFELAFLLSLFGIGATCHLGIRQKDAFPFGDRNVVV
jgi:hypothetical protein